MVVDAEHVIGGHRCMLCIPMLKNSYKTRKIHSCLQYVYPSGLGMVNPNGR